MKKRILYSVLAIVAIMTVAASAGLFSASFLTSSTITATSPAQPYIDQGKFYLTSRYILGARDQFKLAVAAEPGNQEANFLYGITRIAAVVEDGQGGNTAGLDSVREIFELAGVMVSKLSIYGSSYVVPAELATSTPRTGAVLDFFKTKLMPEVDGAIANLQAVNSTTFTSTNNPAAIGKASGAVLTADYADALVIKAMLYALKCNLELLMVYGPDVNIPDIQAAPNELMTYKQLFQDSTFLTPKETERLATARTALISFIDTYSLAAPQLITRSGSAHHLFVVDVPITNEVVSADTPGLNDFVKGLAEIKESLKGPHLFTFAPKVVPNNRFVDLSKLFDTSNPINVRTKLNELAIGNPSAAMFNGLFPLGVTGLETLPALYGEDILGVTGAGPGKPLISVAPYYLFVADPVSPYYSVQPVTINNSGTASLSVSSISLQGSKSADFTLDYGTCGSSFPVVINQGGSCSVTVDLKHPVAGGSRSAELQITTNDPSNQATTISVSGWGQSQTALVPPVKSLLGSPVALFVDPSTTGTIYTAVNKYNNNGPPYYNGSGVYKSTDSGITWNQIKNGIATDYNGGDPYMYTFVMAPNNSQALFASTSSGAYKSLDGGATWALITNPANSGISGFAFAPSSPATVYGASYNYLYLSINSGTNWTNIGTIPQNSIQSSLVVDPASPATLYIGANSGVYKTVDSGLTWLPVNNGLPSTDIYSQYTSSLKFISSTLYAATNSGLYKSGDGGSTWVQVTINGNSYVTGIIPDPSSAQTMYAYSYNGIFKTTDGGTTWNALLDSQGASSINYLAVSPLDNKLYAASSRYDYTTPYSTTYTDIYKFSTATAPPTPAYNLNILRNGTGSGSVQYFGYAFSMIPVTNCVGTASCGGSYTEAAYIHINANPVRGSVFAGWTGCDETYGTECQVNLFASQTVTATFNRDTKPLILLASPSGGSYTTPPEVTLAASKAASIYYTLDGSTPTVISLKYSAPILISKRGATTVKYVAIDPFGTASAVGMQNYNFSLTTDKTLTVTSSGSGSGQVTSDTGGISCSRPVNGTCVALYPDGSPITLTAITTADSTFVGWTGDCTGVAPCILAMSSNKNTVAQFGLGPNNLGPVAKIELTGYNSANDAYSAAGLHSTILAVAGIQSVEILQMNQGKNIILRGGYNSLFTTPTTQPTILKGTLIIDSGSLRVENVKLRP